MGVWVGGKVGAARVAARREAAARRGAGSARARAPIHHTPQTNLCNKVHWGVRVCVGSAVCVCGVRCVGACGAACLLRYATRACVTQRA